MSLSEPSPRTNFFSASRHSSAYQWGGYYYDTDRHKYSPVDDLDILHYFHLASGTWNRLQLKGPHPPGTQEGACSRIGDSIFFYGGKDEYDKVTESLYELNLTTLTWQELSTPGDGSPMKKYGCRMMECNGTLVLHGGQSADGDDTNKLHIFDVATRTWSSPQVTGDIPEPDAWFTFTRVSQNKVVKCGGWEDRAIYVLDLSTMHWTKVLQSGPDFGFNPTATCIDYDSDHAQLLIIGHLGQWLLDVATWEMKKIQDTDKLPGYEYLERSGHSSTMLSSTTNSVEIVIFGGSNSPYNNLSATTLLILKKNEDEKWWRISAIIYGDKLKERRDSYQSYSTSEVNEDAVQVEQVGTKNENKENSQHNSGSSTQGAAEAVSTLSQTSQTSASQSSSQPASSESVPQADKNAKENLHEDQMSTEKEHFSDDVTAALLKKQSIRRKVANLLLQGLPGTGKTSLLDRLLNRPFLAYYSSTGICERIVIVEIGHASTLASAYTCEDNTWKVTDFDESMISQLDTCKVFISPKTRENPRLDLQPHEAIATRLDQPKSEIESHVKEVLRKHNIKNIVDLQTKNSLYIRDTGGQVEFQESLSLLIFGPSIFIYVLRTDIELSVKNIIQYRSSNKKMINQYESSISTMDALVQFLTSVSAIQTTEESMFQVDGASMCHEPIVFIVGTHIDSLGPEARSILDNINKILHEIICERKFSDFIRYANNRLRKVMYEIDNIYSDDQLFQILRSDINNYIKDRNEFYVEYPVSYLLFCLELQNLNETVLSMEKCKKLASKFYIQENEIQSLLNFLHFRVGIIQHYNVSGISDVIIKEPQVLFNKVTELILKTFLSSGPVSSGKQDKFVQKGILEESAFQNLLTKKDEMTPDQFLMFLLHLRIAVPFTDKEGVKKYIIPSVLNHVEKSPSNTLNTDIAPLAINFKLGHCPKGLLGMLISFLLSPEEEQELTFDLLEDQIFQDQLSLRVNSSEDADEICLRSHLSHLEVRIVKLENYSASNTSEIKRASRKTTPTEVCGKVRHTLDNCLQLSFQKLHYNCTKIGACFSLMCPEKTCCQLHEVIQGKTEFFMRCSAHNCKMLLPESGFIWFHEESSSIQSSDSSNGSTSKSGKSSSTEVNSATEESTNQISSSTEDHSCSSTAALISEIPSTDLTKVPEFGLKKLTILKWTDKDGQSHILRLRDDISSKWRDVGDVLDLTPSRLDGILSHRLGDVRQCCRDVLLDWITNGSSDYAASWEGLLSLLEDLALNDLAISLRTALDTFLP